MGIKPLHDRILVKRIAETGKTPGGIIIPDTAQEKPMEGKVVAAGGGARSDDGKLQPLDVKKGDRILFGKWSGNEVTVEGDEYIIMKESDVMGILS
jgi:chaperonin GroES